MNGARPSSSVAASACATAQVVEQHEVSFSAPAEGVQRKLSVTASAPCNIDGAHVLKAMVSGRISSSTIVSFVQGKVTVKQRDIFKSAFGSPTSI